MKYLKQYMIIGAVTMITSCSDFLDTFRAVASSMRFV